jgi:Tfp pilus assembly PilM family ATPase
VMDPFRNIDVNTKRFDVEYIRDQAVNFAVAVGLAVRLEED